MKRPRRLVDTHFVDWYWIILGLGGFAATFLLLTAAGGTKSASERMLKTYAELLTESRRAHSRSRASVQADEPPSTHPADGADDRA